MAHRTFPGIEGFQVKVPIIFGDPFFDQSLDDFGLVKGFRAIEKIESFRLPLGNFQD